MPGWIGRGDDMALPLGVLVLPFRLLGLTVALGLSALVLGCADDQESVGGQTSSSQTGTLAPETPTPRAEPTSTPPTVAELAVCPVAQAVCAAAAGIESAIRTGDVDYLMSKAQFLPYNCPVVLATGKGGPYPLCDDDAGRGQELQGFAFLNDVTRLIYGKSSLDADLTEVTDAQTRGGDWRVRTIACRLDASAPLSECSPSLVVLGYLNGGQLVSASVLMFEVQAKQPSGGEFLIERLTNAFTIWRQDTDILLGGGTLSKEPAHAATFGFGPFYRWSPP